MEEVDHRLQKLDQRLNQHRELLGDEPFPKMAALPRHPRPAGHQQERVRPTIFEPRQRAERAEPFCLDYVLLAKKLNPMFPGPGFDPDRLAGVGLEFRLVLRDGRDGDSNGRVDFIEFVGALCQVVGVGVVYLGAGGLVQQVPLPAILFQVPPALLAVLPVGVFASCPVRLAGQAIGEPRPERPPKRRDQDAGGGQQQFLGVECHLKAAEQLRPRPHLTVAQFARFDFLLDHAKLLVSPHPRRDEPGSRRGPDVRDSKWAL